MIVKELPETLEYIELYPLSDLHAGDILCDEVLYHKFVAHILKAPHRYIICAGDLMNNNLKHSVGSVYEDEMTPGQQKKWLKKELEPLKDRILVMVGGNHENRSRKETDQDITEEIAEYLKVPYRREEAYLKLSFGRHTRGPRRNGKRVCYGIYVQHGEAAGGGKRPGSTINNIEMLSLTTFAHVYIVGHSHKRIAYRARYRMPDLKNNTWTWYDQLYVSASSWLNYGGYGARKGYRAQAKGTSPIILSGREQYAKAEV